MNESYNAEPMKVPRLIPCALWRRDRHSSASSTSFISLTSLASFHDRVRLNLHQHFRRDQLAHFHHAGCRTDFAEKFAVRAPDFLPFGNVGHKDARPHDVLQAGASLRERSLDVLDRLHSLRAQIAHAYNLSVRPRRRRSGHGNDVADPHRPRIAHNRLPRRTARNILTRHLGFPFFEVLERIIYSSLVWT